MCALASQVPMSSVAVVNGQPRDPSSATSKENSQTPGPPPPITPQSQTGPTVSIAQTSQAQTSNPSAPQANSISHRDTRRSEIYRYSGPKPLFAAAWANKNDRRFRLAVGSIVEREQGNNVTLIELDEALGSLVERGSFGHEFPPNQIGFIPDLENRYPDLIATSADFLRLWRIHPNNSVTEEAILSSNKSSQFTAPLTNFDWNEVEPRLIGTSSIDTTCTIYDVEAQQAVGLIRPISFSVKTQLIAHDKPVHDIAFSRIFNGKDNFATVGADGSARMFDLRHLEHSTIVYEDPLKLPLMRVAWNKQEHYHLATFAQDSTEVIIIDIRMPCSPLARLKNHNGAVNGLAWAPHSAHHICTASDDAQALIWDLQNMPRPVEDPILAYSAGGEAMDAAGPSNQDTIVAMLAQDPNRKEIYGYDAPYNLYASAWSCATDPQRRFRLAVSSFIEEYSNKISIVQLDESAGELVLRNTFDHPYPATKLMWIPDGKGTYPDLIATSGDYLRLWRLGADNNAKIETLLNTNRTAEYCAPLTSFDWNELDLNLIGTSSIDTTCTVWQLETGQAIGTTRATVDGTVRTQLIAHDKEVFDISFSRGNRDMFASVGADGSVRLFDLRHLEHSTIIYEDPQRTPLLRLAWNRNDHNYIATFACESNEVIILDMRIPCHPVARLANHRAPINGLSWAPHSSTHICTAADDAQALIWDVHEIPRPILDPILAYQAAGEVNQIHWSTAFPDWISICYANRLEILRV
ncbi:WD domain, G-beta repeat protein [Ostertagia ostertagi]